MNKKLYLSFLWHMHQPYYKDDISNTTMMPWVFLHGTKDYYDIPWYQEEFSNIKATFNLVPSLLKQLESYIDGSANDKLLNIIKKDVYTLKHEELMFLEEYLFLPNEQHMIKPLPRYYELLLRFKSGSISDFSDEEIIDTQVLFLISWCGNYLRKNSKLIDELIYQGKSYSQAQKVELLEEMIDFIKEIVPYYKSLQNKGQIDISTTPFYHPILPLLLDRKSAKEARSDVIVPNSIATYDEFASLQVKSAVDYFEKSFSKKPQGFWPSEGSVSLKTANLLAKNGVKWACSDEEILFKSIGNYNKEELYKPYFLKTESGEIGFYFRDKYLSDLIGFDYSKKSANEAANDFISHLKNIYLSSDESVVVPVILDGENAWEFYPDNAMPFFKELYRLLGQQEWCETVVFDEIPTLKDIKMNELPTLASGSWINGNFDIWIGSHEKNRAWELLDMTKNSYDSIKDELDEKTLKKIEKEFLIALGSDWFWWYGDDHYTELNHQFDEQFRFHLKNIYRLMDLEVPVDILVPIIQKQQNNLASSTPSDFIEPDVNGKINSFYEWLNSGFIDIKKEFSTMDSSSSIIDSLNYGINKEDSLYIYFKGNKLVKLADKQKEFSLKLELKLEDEVKTFNLHIKKGIFEINQNEHDIKVAFDEGIELEISHISQQKVGFSFEVLVDKKMVQKYPLYDESILDLENLLLKSWYI